jgi:hypothetical protein
MYNVANAPPRVENRNTRSSERMILRLIQQ